MDDDYTVRVEAAAERLGIKPRMVLTLIAKGALDALRIQGGKRPYYISERSLQEEIRKRQSPPEATADPAHHAS